jgi:hypothetical protein
MVVFGQSIIPYTNVTIVRQDELVCAITVMSSFTYARDHQREDASLDSARVFMLLVTSQKCPCQARGGSKS